MEVLRMIVEKLEQAKDLLIQTYLAYEEALEPTDDNEDPNVSDIDSQKETVKSFVGYLDVQIVKMRNASEQENA